MQFIHVYTQRSLLVECELLTPNTNISFTLSGSFASNQGVKREVTVLRENMRLKKKNVNHGLPQFTICVCITWYRLVRMGIGIMSVRM